MPYKNSRKLNNSDSGHETQESVSTLGSLEPESLKDEEDGASDWLEEMGLTASSLPALKSKDKEWVDEFFPVFDLIDLLLSLLIQCKDFAPSLPAFKLWVAYRSSFYPRRHFGE